jgi:drug/metabolite transporter (DMT)-like permease
MVLGVSLLAQRASSLRRGTVSRRQLAILGVSGVLGQGVASILFIFSLGEIGAGRTVVLFSTAPLFALPLGMLFLRERITWWVVGGTALAMAGVVLLA